MTATGAAQPSADPVDEPIDQPGGQPAGLPFDLLGPLPSGTTVLEASAGTGKTFTIAGLVARYIAEGVVGMDELLVVSFSRDATRELRERVRERLVSARDGLADPVRVDPRDHVLAHLADAATDEVAIRRRRLADALGMFDAATVTTTHGFCQQVMLALGTVGDHDPGDVLVEDTGDLIREVADDLYLRKWGVAGAEPAALPVDEFRELARAVATDPATRLVPEVGVGGLPEVRVRIAGAVRREVERRKRRLGMIDYDDLLLRLAATLSEPVFGPAARARLRARYRVVLVDEFQDTDPVQWSILRESFHGHRTLVLIGDPKQAIYGFRGADVHAYLDAVRVAGTVHTLPVNFRSDARLADGLEAIFRGAALGDPRIRVVPVTAAHEGPMVATAAGGPPVQLRLVPRQDLPLVQNGTAKTAQARAAVVADLTAEVVELLSNGTRVHLRDGRPERGLQPGDIAVLVRTNSQAQLVSGHLGAAGVPVVVTGRASVFATAAAAEWQLLLEALEQPHRTTRVRRLALGCFVGLSAAELAGERGDRAIDELALNLRSWARVLDERGVAALFEAVSLALSVQSRVLGQVGGERLLTDLRHIAQALHEAAIRGQLGLAGLLVWLRQRRVQAAGDSGLERSRRLDSDAAAVQIITVHTSKGLEFPVVMVPFGWDFWAGHEVSTATFHDGDQRVRDVGGRGAPDWDTHVSQHKRDEQDDELRLMYVAVTRAQSRLLLWWAPTSNTLQAPLHRLLLNPDPAAAAPARINVPSDAAAVTAFEALAAGSRGGMGVEVVRPRPTPHWAAPAHRPVALSAALLGRSLDLTWRRTSYSALTASEHEQPGFGSEPEVAQTDDELDTADVPTAAGGDPDAAGDPGDDAHLRAVMSAWDALPSGPRFGTVVHALLEVLDEPGDAAALAAATAQSARPGSGLDGQLADVLTAGMTAALATPLGPLAAGASLQDIAAGDRLRELEFELPLAGGDGALAAYPVLADLVPLWRRHCPTGPLASYADALARLDPAPLRGYLTGSIDVVLRVGGGPAPRYLVVDYKTNRLGGYDEPLTAWHYRPEAMERAMIEAHYPLQALLYGVALHRYLRWRQPGYNPEIHLGGALYLFLRGMSGPAITCADGSIPGVFGWRPPSSLVTEVSDVLAGSR